MYSALCCIHGKRAPNVIHIDLVALLWVIVEELFLSLSPLLGPSYRDIGATYDKQPVSSWNEQVVFLVEVW